MKVIHVIIVLCSVCKCLADYYDRFNNISIVFGCFTSLFVLFFCWLIFSHKHYLISVRLSFLNMLKENIALS